MTVLLVSAVLVAIPATERADECRYMTADGQVGYDHGEIVKTIGCFANRFEVAPWKALNVAECESSLYPRARNGPYRGIYQIGPVWSAWWSSFADVQRWFDLRASVWSVRSNVAIAIRRARDGWSPWACA